MSVQSEITRLENAKSDIATAIANKGVTVPSGTKLDGMAALIGSIESGGGSVGEPVHKVYIQNEVGVELVATIYPNDSSSKTPSPVWISIGEKTQIGEITNDSTIELKAGNGALLPDEWFRAWGYAYTSEYDENYFMDLCMEAENLLERVSNMSNEHGYESPDGYAVFLRVDGKPAILIM